MNEADTLLHITVKDTVIKTTFPHPFYVVGKGWVEGKDLVVGDVLKLANGEMTAVKALEVEELENPVKVYNFEVEDWHTYYVSEYGVLVHNSGTNPCAAGSKPPSMSPSGAGRKGAFGEAKRQNGIPVTEQPISVSKPDKYKGIGREYEFQDGTKIRDDAFGHEYPDDPTQNRGPHFNDPDGNHFDY